MTKAYVFAAACIAAVATPALARAAKPVDVAPVEAVPPARQASAAAPHATRYCVVESVTGSIIQRKTCRTREQWMAEGFDPLAK